MAQRIRFFDAAGGGRIAFATVGSGPPLLLPSWWVSHLERDWSQPGFRRFFEPLAEHFTVIRYDRAGVGLSERERNDFRFETELAQLEALVEHLGLGDSGELSLLGFSCGGPPAVSFTAKHPASVERLVFVNSFAHGPSLAKIDVQRALSGLIRASWGVGAKAISDLFAPDRPTESRKEFAKNQRDWTNAENAACLMELTFAMDCREDAKRIDQPAMVLHRRDDQTVHFDAGRALAALLRNASFQPLEGNAHVPWEGDGRELVDAILEFLLDEPVPTTLDGAPDPKESSWRREGDLWRLCFGGQVVHVAHRKGLEDLAVLLAHPLREIPATELAGGVGGPTLQDGDPGELLDDQARREYADRARAVEAELADAEARNDLGQLERLQVEREALLAELRGATGLGGRSRSAGGSDERARKAVSARIRDGIRRIREVHPALAEHLEASVSTGSTCVYRPEPSRLWRT